MDDGGGEDGAGEDAVAGFLAGVDLGQGDVDGGVVGELGAPDAVEGVAAQAVLGGVEGVQVPVVAVVGEALRGDLALAVLAGLVFLVSYGISNGWISEEVRVIGTNKPL